MRGYAAALAAGTASPYECLRFFENAHYYRGDDRPELERRAVCTLIRHDPLLLATTPHGSFVRGLSEADIQACVGSWSLEDVQLAAFLEGQLRMATVSPRESDHAAADRAMIALALAALERARVGFAGDREFLRLYSNALRMSGDERYTAAFEDLLAATEPEWHAHELRWAMEHAEARGDWARYDALRQRWGAMPKNAHVCECAVNYVANIDGLRALTRGDRADVIRCLHAAVAVSGCPHLNSGGACLRLASELIARDEAKDEVRNHLDAVEQYCRTEEVVELRKQLDERG